MEGYKGFVNKNCKYYPCHDMEDINCMFCCCPLYFTDCSGNYKMIESRGKKIKDCSQCTYPHHFENYEDLMEKLTEEIYKNAEDISSNEEKGGL